MAASPRNPAFAPWLELRAHKIADPVERLRFLRREMRALETKTTRGRWYGAIFGCTALVAVLAAARPVHAPPRTAALVALGRRTPSVEPVREVNGLEAPEKVWRVEATSSLETYSNGLRVDLTFSEDHTPRAAYPVFPPAGGAEPVRYRSTPAGIVYHTTESNLADFDETQNGRLKQLGRNLLEIVRGEHAYHYVIDRFGRVYRVVEEADVANHAGHSIWADASGIYVNLNSSFLAVAFEAQTGAPDSVTAAQIEAGRMLTEMLRSKYAIPAVDCVTHAQVSVSGVNSHIGAHTDWGSQFPFASIGLPDNYALPLPSIADFGFEYDPAFVQAVGGHWKGLSSAEAQVTRAATAEGIPVARYRGMLQHRYSDILGVVTAEEDTAHADAANREEQGQGGRI